VGQFRSAGGLVLLSGRKLGPQISCRSQIRALRNALGVFCQRCAWRRFSFPVTVAVLGSACRRTPVALPSTKSSMPAASRTARTAVSAAALPGVSRALSSAYRLASLMTARLASSCRVQPSKLRAARTCTPEIAFWSAPFVDRIIASVTRRIGRPITKSALEKISKGKQRRHTDYPHPILELETSDSVVVEKKFRDLIPHVATKGSPPLGQWWS
jgi:hypothetical protein